MLGRRPLYRLLRRSRAGIAGAVLFLALCIVAMLAPLLSPFDPLQQNLLSPLRAPGAVVGNRKHMLGTDQFGRDVLSRLMSGLRVSLAVAGLGVVGSAILGSVVGIIAGANGGGVDSVLMRAVDFQLSIPFLLIAILWVAFVGSSLVDIVAVVVLNGWVLFARVVRGKSLSVRAPEFVLAATALGASPIRIVVKHMTPQVFPEIAIVATFLVGRAVLLESSLGFLALGIPPPTPTLGSMISEGRNYLSSAWWLTTFPGAAITLFVLAVNLLGDGLRDALDPKLKL